ncbi:VWA domain-containing protein [Streptomyces sp. NPDC001858]
MTTEDIKLGADRPQVHVDQEFFLSVAPRVLRRADRVADGIAYVLAVDDSSSMDIKADAATNEFADPNNPQDTSRKDVAVAGVRELVAALPPDAGVDVITFGQHAGLRFSGTAGELRNKGSWPGNAQGERWRTDIEGALREAYAQLGRRTAASRRVVLLSDGLPNSGESDPRRLAAIAQEAAGRELHTDVIGIGEGADYPLLEGLAPTGMTAHVSSRATAAEKMREITASFAAYGRDVVAGSAELSLQIHPNIKVVAVYQIDPVRRRLDGVVSDGAGHRPSRVRLTLGAVGAGDEGQLRYVLKLRAPDRTSRTALLVAKASGRIGSGAEARELGEATTHAWVVNDPNTPILRPDYRREVDAAELEQDINNRVAAAGSTTERERIYEEGIERARRIPDPVLIAAFQQAAAGLREGMQAKDVLNESRASSSRSSSSRNKRDWFKDIQVEMPDEIRASRRQRSLYDDDGDTDSYGGGSYGGGSGSGGGYGGGYDPGRDSGRRSHGGPVRGRDTGADDGADAPTDPPRRSGS